MPSWNDLVASAPALATFGAARLEAAPSYLATVTADGTPQVHPVTPIVTSDGLFIFMEPTSPKGQDLLERHSFALHNGVPDNAGTGGEFWVRGIGRPVEDDGTRTEVTAAASYEPAAHYVLFELLISEARALGYGDVDLPEPRRWRG